ncbi:LysR substrate-binding domain-containing protein [Alcaligenes sp. WGS1538]|uniref:LysR substrate-binding domain-containing protein n=1 Tax=Alcaligenes sp. WGS1538 TaxID=3366811 RepID=UPI00372D46D0
MKITLEEMQVFLAVVDSGTLTAAAEQLGQTASGASRSLSRLESKLATTLLRRTTRRLELTEEGMAFRAQARDILDSVERLEEQMAARQGQPAGVLRVDAASPFMLHVVVPLIAGYRERYPAVQLELSNNEGFIDLLERRTDVALRIGELKDSTLHARPIGRSRLRVLASPEYLVRHRAPQRARDLDCHALLGFSQPESLNEWPLMDGDKRLRVRPTLRASSGETLRQLALDGNGLVCLSDFMTGQDRREGRLVQVLEDQTVPVFQPVNAVYYRQTAIAARIASFVDYLAQQVRERGLEL